MAAQIVWWFLTLCVLALFYLPLAEGRSHCFYSRGCYICRYRSPTKDNCLARRFCYNRIRRWVLNSVCIKYKQQEVKQLCGISPSLNIVGGIRSNEGDWPWQVSLQNGYSSHFCGGSLIDKYWVLTASHCVQRLSTRDFFVVFGEYDLKRKSPREQYRRIKNIFVHPYFHSGGTYPNDVALIQLENYVEFNEFISPICLPSFDDHYATDGCSITGWGETRGTGDNSRLRVLKAKILDPRVCKRSWYGQLHTDYHICVNNGLTGACSGDSGGPLSCFRSTDGRYVVAGVTSWGRRTCHVYGFPSIYTNIRTYVPWIKSVMESASTEQYNTNNTSEAPYEEPYDEPHEEPYDELHQDLHEEPHENLHEDHGTSL